MVATFKTKYNNYEYAKAVVNWLTNTKEYGLRTNKNPHTYDKQEQSNGGGGCFIAGTKVLLANGTLVAINKVAEGQEVLTRDSGVGVVSSERVVSTHKSGDLYGINDDEPFFTGAIFFFHFLNITNYFLQAHTYSALLQAFVLCILAQRERKIHGWK
jgi:hypothetical protein